MARNASTPNQQHLISTQTQTDDRDSGSVEPLLGRAEVTLHAIINSTDDLVWAVDSKELRLITCNSAMRSYWKTRGVELCLGQRLEEIFSDTALIAVWNRLYQRVLSEGALSNTYFNPKSGLVLDLKLNLLIDAAGVWGISVFARDVTAQRQAEKSASEQAEQYKNLFEQMISGLMVCEVICDENGMPCDHRFVTGNPAFERLTGHKVNELCGLRANELPIKWPPDLIRKMYAVAMGGVPIEYERYNESLRGHYETRVFSPRLGLFAHVFTDITDRARTHNRLEASEANLRRSQEVARLGSYVFNLGSDSWDSSPVLDQIFGIDHSYTKNAQSWLALVHPDDSAGMQQYLLHHVIGNGIPFDRTYRIVRPFDGQIRWLHGRGEIECKTDGTPDRMIGTIQDVTEAKLAADALAKDEAELAAIYEHAPMMMMLLDQQGKIRRANAAARQFTGNGDLESLGLRPGDIFSCENSKCNSRGCGHGPHCSSCQLNGLLGETFNNGSSFHRVEIRQNLKRLGSQQTVNLYASTAKVDIADESLVLLCLEDITEQRKAEKRVREQSELLDATRDAIVVIDQNGLVTTWNRGAELLFGWSWEEACGEDLTRLIIEEESQSHFASNLDTIRNDGTWQGELTLRARTGEDIVCLGNGVVMMDDSRRNSLLLYFCDITEMKRLENRLLRVQRLDSLGSLAGGVAHDLNNVFTPIMISLELLREIASRPKDIETIRLLSNSVQRGADIVRQLLLFSRGDSAPRAEMSLGEEIRNIHQMMRETFPKNISLSVQYPKDLGTVVANVTEVHQILLNLCLNARDAMPKGGQLCITAENVTVEEQFAREQLNGRPGPHVLLRVTDTGTGIAPQVMEKLFEPFFTTKPAGSGTGLGLATTMGIVRSIGGFITVASRPEEGSEFGVYLPLCGTACSSSAGGDDASVPHGQNELILVVDDEEHIRHAIDRSLLSHGYSTLLALDGAQALEELRVHGDRVQLIVTDLMMPRIGGLEFVQSIPQCHRHIPIITMSGLPKDQGSFSALQIPEMLHLAKPFSSKKLILAVHEVLQSTRTVAAVTAS